MSDSYIFYFGIQKESIVYAESEQNLTYYMFVLHTLLFPSREVVGSRLCKSPLFFSNVYLYCIQRGIVNILCCIILHVAHDVFDVCYQK